MPTYEYVCDAGHETSHRQSMSEDPLETCPREDCESAAERKISAGLGVHAGPSGSSPGGGDACADGTGFT